MLLLFKLLVTPALIYVATRVSRRFGEATGGWLVGLPLTSGPVAVFLAIEQGPAFARLAAAGSLEGTAGQAIFATTYALLAGRYRWPGCLAGASVAFFACAFALSALTHSLAVLVAIAVAALIAALIVIPAPARVEAPAAAPRWDLPVRMAVAT